MSTSKIPITRINKWFSREDQELQVSMGREFLEGQNFTVILYRVNREMTESDNLYGEASNEGIRYFPPVELKVLPTIAENVNKTYNKNGTLNYLQDGQLSFIIYDAQLKELDLDISFGDYIGYPISETELRYFSVVNPNNKFFANKNTILGYVGTYRTVLCAPIDKGEFDSI